MLKVVFDTNVVLDYFGIGRGAEAQKTAVELVTALWRQGAGFLVLPTTLKDLEYIATAQLKRDIRSTRGEVSAEEARAITTTVEAMLEAMSNISTVISLGAGDCEMARSLCNVHHDYEDNLIVAACLRIGADFLVTRDRALAGHCAVACMEPQDALALLAARS